MLRAMAKKPRDRTERREHERSLRRVVRDREKLALLETGGAAEHPIVVTSSAVIEVRIGATPCPQCGGEYRLVAHDAPPGTGLRACAVTCRLCGVSRTLWFQLAAAPIDDAN
jgi:hypothetical protein